MDDPERQEERGNCSATKVKQAGRQAGRQSGQEQAFCATLQHTSETCLSFVLLCDPR